MWRYDYAYMWQYDCAYVWWDDCAYVWWYDCGLSDISVFIICMPSHSLVVLYMHAKPYCACMIVYVKPLDVIVVVYNDPVRQASKCGCIEGSVLSASANQNTTIHILHTK